MKTNEILVNQDIKAEKVLLIFPDNTKKEMLIKDALREAEEQELDLVQVSMQAIPICKLVDYNKFIYEKNKKEKEQKKKQKQGIQEVKEIRLSVNIDVNDLTTKANQANKFLEKNKKIKLTLRLRGRENKDYALKTINEFMDNITVSYDKSQKPVLEGRVISMIITPVLK